MTVGGVRIGLVVKPQVDGGLEIGIVDRGVLTPVVGQFELAEKDS